MEVSEELCAEDRARVGAYWWKRAEGEITSWVGFGHVLDDLRLEGSPATILALAERAVADEHRHAMFCRDWAVRFGHPGGEPTPRGERALAFPGAAPRENRLLRIALCCFTETVGCFTLRYVRPFLRHAELKKLNQRHTADELLHSRVGWGHLSVMGEPERDVLRASLQALFALLQDACCAGSEEEREDLIPFGYFTSSLLRQAHDDALQEVIRPGLRHLGIASAE